jgi:molecular chaperone GrpE (heat shock protein)
MAISEDDLQKKRERLDKLREQIADAEAAASSSVQDQSNAIEAKQLDAEMARLEARLAQAKAAAKVSVAKEGAAGPLAQVTDQLEAAVAAKDNPVGPVDTNADSSADDKNKG